MWAFFLNWFNKAVVAGFGALVLKASGSEAQPGVQNGVKIFKKHARRMSMGAGHLLSEYAGITASPFKSKAKAL